MASQGDCEAQNNLVRCYFMVRAEYREDKA